MDTGAARALSIADIHDSMLRSAQSQGRIEGKLDSIEEAQQREADKLDAFIGRFEAFKKETAAILGNGTPGLIHKIKEDAEKTLDLVEKLRDRVRIVEDSTPEKKEEGFIAYYLSKLPKHLQMRVRALAWVLGIVGALTGIYFRFSYAFVAHK